MPPKTSYDCLFIVSGNANISQLNCPFITCAVQASGNCCIDDISTQTADFQTHGSGSIECENGHIGSLRSTCYGTGKIRCGCSADTVKAETYASGSVILGRVIQKLHATSRGSVDIKATAVIGCVIHESKSGSGSVSIKRTKNIPVKSTQAIVPNTPPLPPPPHYDDAPPPPYSAE